MGASPTVVALLTRLYEPDSGEIRANGVPILEIDLTLWCKQIAFVHQDPFIFNDTLRANVLISNEDASESMDRDYAIIAIAHRRETAVNADRIYTLEAGDDRQIGRT